MDFPSFTCTPAPAFPQQDGDRFQQTKGTTVAALAFAVDGLQGLQDVFAAQLAER